MYNDSFKVCLNLLFWVVEVNCNFVLKEKGKNFNFKVKESKIRKMN